MTSTLYFYKLPINLLDKNFILENLETYLATLTPITKSSFQYQRFEMEKTIKLNLSQDYQTYNGLTRYNYLKITQLNTNNTTSIYYYFIKKARQVSESTIAFDLVMDTLNTFKFKSTFQSGQDYTLSDKSLITREHKDRFGSLRLSIGKKAIVKKSKIRPTYYYFPLVGKELIINELPHGEEEVIYNYTLGTQPPVNPFYPVSFDIYFYDKETGWMTEQHTLLANKLKLTIATTTEYEEDDIDIYVETLKPRNNHGIIVYETETFYKSRNEYMVIKFHGEATNKCYGQCLSYYTDFFDTFSVSTYSFIRPRKIFYFQEGIESITFKKEDHMLLDEDELSGWYVAFSSANAVVQSDTDTSARYVNPVQVDFIKDNGYVVSTSSARVVRVYPSQIPQYSQVEEWLEIDLTQLEASGYVEINGVQYTSSGYTYQGTTYTKLWVEKKNNSDTQFRRVSASLQLSPIWENVGYIDFYGLNSCKLYTAINDGQMATYKEDFYIGSGTSSITGTSPAFDTFDLTDPKLIKVIAFPYSPRSDLIGDDFSNISSELVWNSTLSCLELKKAQNNGFNRNLQFSYSPFRDLVLEFDSPITSRDERNIKYESKLFHSDYYLPKFVYDSFSFGFRLEDMDEEKVGQSFSTDNMVVQYVCSGNVQSKFAFIFNEYVCKRELQDYNNVLVVERNNEKALFNNAYINYIRSGGFRFDTKNADTQKMVNGLTIAMSSLGAIGSIVGGAATNNPMGIAAGIGLVVGTATRTISAIHSAQQNDRAISQKLLSSSQQGTNVSTSEDIDILKAYTNNKAKLCYYSISDILKNALWDLFHYFGYRCNEYKIPQTNTRCNFNFIQGDIVLKDFTFNDDIARDIIRKWNEGVTFMHYNNSLGYDFNQEYENFENNML